MHGELATAEVVAEWPKRVQNKLTTRHKIPAFFETWLFADKTVDANGQDQLEPPVEKQTLPTGNELEVTFQEFFNNNDSPNTCHSWGGRTAKV